MIKATGSKSERSSGSSLGKTLSSAAAIKRKRPSFPTSERRENKILNVATNTLIAGNPFFSLFFPAGDLLHMSPLQNVIYAPLSAPHAAPQMSSSSSWLAVSCASRIVHVFEGSSLKVVVRVPSPVVAILAHELEV